MYGAEVSSSECRKTANFNLPINPVPNIDERIKKLTKELGASNPDTLNIEYEEADMNFEEIFDEKKDEPEQD